MRSLTRLGVAAVATALASATALTGATLANAQGPGTVHDSPSRVSVSGKGATTTVSYANKSGMDLTCFSYVGTDPLVSEVHAAFREMGAPDAPPPVGLMERLFAAIENGQLGIVGGAVEDGGTAEFSDISDELNASLTDGSFTPVALAVCSSGADQYAEMEISGAGAPAGLGSLDSALTGLGSSGSVAESTGPLGS